MDPRPTAIVEREVEKFLQELRDGRQHSNADLGKAIWSALRPTIDEETRPKLKLVEFTFPSGW